MPLVFEEYQPRKIVNVYKHVDGPWFWGKYTAHPYIGCRSGCTFCYERGTRYLRGRDPVSFDTHIRIKVNAVDLLSKELPRLEKEIISVGDWQQPAEDRYRLSRGMLKVVLEQGFPLFIIERSPLLAHDLDLLIEINHKSWVGVLYSISSLDPALKHAFEPRSPGVKRRLLAVEQLSRAGIYAGVSMMPINFMSLPWGLLDPAVSILRIRRSNHRRKGLSIKVRSWMFSRGMVFSTLKRTPFLNSRWLSVNLQCRCS